MFCTYELISLKDLSDNPYIVFELTAALLIDIHQGDPAHGELQRLGENFFEG